MYRLAILILMTLLLSCDHKPVVQVKFGCDPPCEKKPWLTFSYDCAYLFQDTSGSIKSSIENDTLLQYTRHHTAPRISKKNIETMDEALSCGLWTCIKTPVKKELYNPENIIVFVLSTVPVAYITICSKSDSVDCKPHSDNAEIAIFSSILNNITRKD